LSRVHVVLPTWVDDPARPSGGNRYGRKACDGLRRLGWTVVEHLAPGEWPQPDAAAPAQLARELAAIPNGERVLVDGLIAVAAATVLVAASERLDVVVLVHLPAEHGGEARVLLAARAVVVTSDWTARRLAALHGVPAVRLIVAPPGVEPAPLATGSADGGELLCVGAVTAIKGQDLLVAALRLLASDRPVRCTIVGSLEREPAFAAQVRAASAYLPDSVSVRFTGALDRAALAERFASADLLVLPSRQETYGMVLTEALAAGVPAIACDVGGVAETLGAVGGVCPGQLVAPADPHAIFSGLSVGLADPRIRARWRAAARARRVELTGWDVTAARLADALETAGPRR
jgi:glycosyltransferase involved in cell wall biosynthesis